jgi:drug/metabolite transporter (DMT)-like permease
MAAPMTTAALLLVLGSAICHASWNFLLKRSHHKVTFLACAGAIGAAVFFIPSVIATIDHGLTWAGVALGLITGCLHGLYGLSLTRGYHLGDLSSVYPVSRGTGLVLIPVLAVVLLGESISALALAGIVLVILGVYGINLDPHALRDVLAPLKILNRPAGRAALLTGCLIAAYSVWDKNALDELSPLTLNQFAMTGHFLVLLPVVLVAGRDRIADEWDRGKRSILAAGVLIAMAYALVLAALTTSNVAYIAPSREIGIVFGTILGAVVLSESYGTTRIAAAMLIVAGVFVLAIAP